MAISYQPTKLDWTAKEKVRESIFDNNDDFLLIRGTDHRNHYFLCRHNSSSELLQ